MPTRLLLLAVLLGPALALADDPPPVAAPPPEAAAPSQVAAPSPDPAAALAVDPAPPPALPAPTPPAAALTAEVLPPPPTPPPATAPYPRFGIALGLGAPNGASLDFLYRPIPWMRFSIGPSYDYAGWGLNGGVVLSPIRWAVSPTLGLEGGRFLGADLNKYATSASADVQPLLRDVRLQYLTATLGLEFGSQRGFSFALRTGLTWLQIASHGTGKFAGGGTAGSNDAVVTVTNPTVRASAPTLQLVFQYFL